MVKILIKFDKKKPYEMKRSLTTNFELDRTRRNIYLSSEVIFQPFESPWRPGNHRDKPITPTRMIRKFFDTLVDIDFYANLGM